MAKKFQRPLFDILSDIICVNNKTLKQPERDAEGNREEVRGNRPGTPK